jgi:hypothetical protein
VRDPGHRHQLQGDPRILQKTHILLRPLPRLELKRNAGTYQNGTEPVEIVARENRLFLKLGPELLKTGFNAEAELTKHNYSSFTTPRMEVTFTPGTNGVTEYVYIGECFVAFCLGASVLTS